MNMKLTRPSDPRVASRRRSYAMRTEWLVLFFLSQFESIVSTRFCVANKRSQLNTEPHRTAPSPALPLREKQGICSRRIHFSKTRRTYLSVALSMHLHCRVGCIRFRQNRRRMQPDSSAAFQDAFCPHSLQLDLTRTHTRRWQIKVITTTTTTTTNDDAFEGRVEKNVPLHIKRQSQRTVAACCSLSSRFLFAHVVTYNRNAEVG